ncbi:acyl-CoA-like ligand-binding transcription factor [Modestobacter italicus]|uniref:acyl-CoA-like ligand-binding transcription factor n=1 Tax=Modestobacter italicus (strain DSM 44449 / CECT 9708 / BC 501) TaxID=2732864 RepID=UPI001C94A502|nr:TetR family transcriptional regulator [Modestobacter italicus]
MIERGLRERKKADTRAALADAALRLAAERGWEHVTVEAIAGAADVSYRTFFNHFSSKEEALLEPGGPDQPRLSTRLRAQPADREPLTALRTAIREDLAAASADPEQLRTRMTVFTSTPALLPRLLETIATDERDLALAVAERTGQDVDADLGPALVGAVVSAALRVSLMRWHAQGGATPLTDLADEALDTLVAGLPSAVPSH